MSILDQFNVPTINLDFKLMTQNRNILSGLRAIVSETGATVDFAALRASVKQTENRFGVIAQADANVPALTFSNGVPNGFLSEEAATNLLQRSEEFDNAYWTKNGTTITPNVIASPDGTSNADKITASSTGADRRIQRAGSPSAGAYTTSIFAKSAELNQIRIFSVDFVRAANFNLDTGTVSGISGGATATMESYPGGWWRCSVSVPSFAGGSTQIMYLQLGTGGTITAGNGVHIWGAQLETGSRATSYIKTTTTTVTRAKDNVTISDVAIALSTTSGSIQTTSNFPTDYPLIINGLQATVTGIKTIRFEYTTTTIELYVDNVLADSATGTYDWSDLDKIDIGHYNGTDQPNFELRDLIVRKA